MILTTHNIKRQYPNTMILIKPKKSLRNSILQSMEYLINKDLFHVEYYYKNLANWDNLKFLWNESWRAIIVFLCHLRRWTTIIQLWVFLGVLNSFEKSLIKRFLSKPYFNKRTFTWWTCEAFSHEPQYHTKRNTNLPKLTFC